MSNSVKFFSLKKIFAKTKQLINKKIEVRGWIRFVRIGKKISFFVVNDGSVLTGLQLILKENLKNNNFIEFNKILPGTAVVVQGILVTTTGLEKLELKIENLKIIAMTTGSYPLQNKEHSKEFLRTQSDLRARTKYFSAVFRIRNASFFLFHEYFQKKGFHCLQAPILTTNDSEGAGESFFVDSADGSFFNKKALLSVSGQLYAEAYGQVFAKVYSFGPTFRADPSNTRFHSAEFWMLEPEIAFATMKEIINLTKEILQYVVDQLKKKFLEDLTYLASVNDFDLIKRIESLTTRKIPEITYDTAITLINEKKSEKIAVIKWGEDLTKEHEIFLCDLYSGPLFIINYPFKIKAFYMKLNSDQKTVGGFDLLVPGIGELVGGSVRENDYQKIIKMAKIKKVDTKAINWYFSLRQKGYAGSAGFGMGFDRFLLYITGVKNIRDVIPFFTGNGVLNW